MTDKVKKFIEENIYLIDTEEFNKLYENAKSLSIMGGFQWGLADEIGELSATLRQCEIYPEKYLDNIPISFLFKDTSLEQFTVPSHIKTVGHNAFGLCGNLKYIEISYGVERIDFEAFCGCGKLEAIALPESIIEIGNNAFRECINLTNVKLSKNLTVIPQGAFCGCSSLPYVTLEEGITTVEQQAFYGCRNLTKISLPESLTKIESHAFSGCSSLSIIKYSGTKAAWRKIRKSNAWRTSTNIIVHCTDGDITLK